MKLFGQIEDHGLRALCFIYSILILLMVSGLKGIANYVSFGLLVLVIILYMGSKRWEVSLKNKICISIAIFMAFYLLTSLLSFDANFFFVEYAYYAIAFSPALLTYAIISRNNNKAAITMLKISLFLWALMTVYSIVLYSINPGIARRAASNQSLTTGSIFGGYPFSIGSALLCVYLFSLIWGRQYDFTRIVKILIIAGCVLLLAVIILTQSTITTLCTIVGILVSIFLNDRGRYTQYKLLKILLFCVVVFATYLVINHNLDSIHSWLNYHSNQLFYDRLREIVNAIFYGDQTSHFAKRSDTIIESLSTFLNNPVIGVGYKYGNVTSIGKAQYGIGNHSEIFDAFAQYGIVGSLPFLMTYYLSAKSFASKYVGIVITLVMLMFFNPFFYFDSSLIVFLVIPLSEFVLKKNSE